MDNLRRIWHDLTTPIASVTHSETRRHSQLLASLLVILVPLGLLLAGLGSFASPERSVLRAQMLMPLIAATALWSAAYILARIGRYEIAAILAASATAVFFYVTAIVNNTPHNVVYVVVPVMIVSMFLSVRTTTLFVLLNLVAILILPLLVESVVYADLIVATGLVLIAAVMGLLAIRHRDQLERHRQAVLAASEERYRVIVEDQTEMICRFQPDGTITFVNEPYASYFNMARDALIGRNALRMMMVEERRKFEELTAALKPDNPVVASEHRSALPSGELKWALWTQRAHFDDEGSIIEFQVVGRDITERKQAEQALAGYAHDLELSNRELEQHHRQLLAIQSAGTAIVSSLDLDQVLKTVAQEITRLTEAEICAISDYDPTDDAVTLLFSYKTDVWWEDDATQAGFPLADYPLTRRVLAERIPQQVSVDQPGADPAELAFMERYGIKNLLMLPMVFQDRVIGLVEIMDRVPRTFTHQEIELTQMLANQAASAIVNARLYQERRRRLDALGSLFQVGTTILSTLDLQQVLDLVAREATRLLNATSAYVCRWDEEQRTTTVIAEWFSPQASPTERVSDLGVTYAGETLSSALVHQGLPAALRMSDRDLPPDWREHFEEYGASSVLLVPLSIRERTVAYVEIWESRYDRIFTEDEVLLAQNLANQAASALENARLYEQAQTEIVVRQRAEDALRQSHLELTTLYEAATAISSDLSLSVVLHTVAQQITEALDSTGCALSVWDPGHDVVQTLVDYNRVYPENTEQPETTYKLTDYPATRNVLETCQPVVIQRDDPSSDEAEIALMEEYDTFTLLMLPLVAGDRVLGLAELVDDVQRRDYTSDQIRLAESLAAQAAVAIENAQLFEESQRRVEELSGLYDTTLAISGALESDLLLQRLHDQVRRLMAPDTLVVALYDAGADEYEVVLAEEEGETVPGAVSIRLPLEAGGLTAWVMRQREPLLVDDLTQDSLPVEPVHGARAARSWLGVPLIARDRLIGAISVQSFQPGAFGEPDRRFLESLASQIASAIENARLVEALREHTAELEQRNEELDAFAHTVAHDVKSLLTRVVGYAELLEQDCAILPVDEMRHQLRAIAGNARKMSNITDELLLLAGVRQVGKATFAPLAMDEIVAEARRRLADMIAEYQADIVIPERWPVAMGYGPWVEEVWYNYLSNAILHGGRPPRVELGAAELEDGSVRFWVRDNGAGLTPEEQTHLFTPFIQLSRVNSKGYGLGLSIVLRVVDKLGGEVGVESQVGTGSVFCFTLPGG